MTQRLKPADQATRDRLKALHETRISPEEFQARLRAPVSDEERADTQALITWFMRRYPTPTERLTYARRAYRRWAMSGE